MAHVSGPLFSMLASGRLDSLVYDRRGYVRRFVPPTNPRTASQGEVRLRLMASQAVISRLGPQARANVRSAFEAAGLPAYRWNALLLDLLLDPEAFAAYQARWSTFVLAGSWRSSAPAAGVPALFSLSYATTSIEGPFVLWALACVLYAIGAWPGAPDPNADDIGGAPAAWVSWIVQ